MGRRVQLNRGVTFDLRRIADQFRSAELTLIEERGVFWLESDRLYVAQCEMDARRVVDELLRRLNQALRASRGRDSPPDEIIAVSLRTWNWSDTLREARRAQMHFSLYQALTGRSLARPGGQYEYLAISVGAYGKNIATCHFCGLSFPGFFASSKDEVVGEHCVPCAVNWLRQMYLHYVHRSLPATEWASEFLRRFDAWLVKSAPHDPTPIDLRKALLEEVRNQPSADTSVDELSLRFRLLELD